MNLETIALGAGCFWCTQAIYARVQGVVKVECGYSNGQTKQPTYEQVCGGNTGHNEVVRLDYRPDIVSLQEILEVFFVIHDPTSLNRQGHDVGTQYRSGIYYTTDAQKEHAEKILAQIKQDAVFDRPVVTELLALKNYWPAEKYHQDYFANHPEQGYCAAVITPKLEKFRATFVHLMKTADDESSVGKPLTAV